MSCQDQLPEILEAAIKKYDIPGASLGLWYQGNMYTAAKGVLNLDTGVEVTEDSAFQIGSITKLFTATLIMQLVEEGKLALHVPIIEYLPEFGLADMESAGKITLWHLLTHTSGMIGDVFIDTGRGEDRLKRFVDRCRFLPMLHPVGKQTSYCNTGWVIAGRIAEAVTYRTWDQLMQEKIFNPLGMQQAFTLAEEALKYRVAMGHSFDFQQGKAVTMSAAYLDLSGAPAGSTTTMSIGDLMRFARMALNDGSFEDIRLLQPDTLKQMLSEQFSVDEKVSRGLGWGIMNWSGTRLLGHDGGTSGQRSFLRLVPEQDLALGLLTNQENADPCYEEVFTKVLSELANTRPPQQEKPSGSVDIDLSLYAGQYDAFVNALEIYVENGRLYCKILQTGVGPDLGDLPASEMTAIDKTCFSMDVPGGLFPNQFQFIEFDTDGRPGYLKAAGRLARRIN